MERRQGPIGGAASLGTDENGTVAIILALVIAPLLEFVGLAVDLSQIFVRRIPGFSSGWPNWFLLKVKPDNLGEGGEA